MEGAILYNKIEVAGTAANYNMDVKFVKAKIYKSYDKGTIR